MTNEFADAFVELLDCNDEVCGTPQFVLVNGKKKRAIIETIDANDVLLGGGIGQAGGFRAQVLKSEFAEKPEKGEPIQANGQGDFFDLIASNDINSAVLLLTAGDLSAEDRG